MDEFPIGATFAEHVIRGVAGRGGMGIVYRAMHLPLKREVALKVIAPGATTDEEFRMRFRHEFEAAASIQHPNVIPIYHAGEHDGLLFVTMRYVDGDDLARLVAAETRLEPVRSAMLIGQVAAALDAAHERGLVHRDVKPANILVETSGDLEHALLTDFGLTKSLQSDTKVTKTGTVIGTFDYTAPEQLDSRPVDARTDVYALGCVLFQMLTGRVPYPRDSLGATLFAHFDAVPPSVTALVHDVPEALDRVIATALAKDPRDRYQSAGDLARAALAAVDRPSLASGLSRLAAGENASGWSWPALPAIVIDDAVPLPGAIQSELDSGPFVGRADALERLQARYERASSGVRQIVLLSGEPGIGKSRLAAELARQVARVRRDRPLRPQRRRLARPLPTVRHRGPALHGPPPGARVPAGARSGAERAGTARAGPAAPPAGAARGAGRGRRDAPLPPVRGRHPRARPRRLGGARRS